MVLKKVLTGFNNTSDPKMIALGAAVKKGLTNNEWFPTLAPMLAETMEAYDAFAASILPKHMRSSVSRDETKQLRAELNPKMYLLAFGVMSVGYGNNVALDSSGFETSSGTMETKTVPSIPVNVMASIPNQANTLEVSCKSNTDTNIYEVRIGLDETNWTWLESDTASKITVTGITAGVIIYVQMRMKNSAGVSNWSDSVRTRLPLPSEPNIRFLNR